MTTYDTKLEDAIKSFVADMLAVPDHEMAYFIHGFKAGWDADHTDHTAAMAEKDSAFSTLQHQRITELNAAHAEISRRAEVFDAYVAVTAELQAKCERMAAALYGVIQEVGTSTRASLIARTALTETK